jgi:hypothetical protein
MHATFTVIGPLFSEEETLRVLFVCLFFDFLIEGLLMYPTLAFNLLWSPGCPKLTTLLPQLLSAGITDMRHHTQVKKLLLNQKKISCLAPTLF